MESHFESILSTLEQHEQFLEGSNKALLKRYDRIASEWNTDAHSGVRRDDLIPELIRFANVDSGQYILDAMCGTGLLAESVRFAHPNNHFVGLDFSDGMLNLVPNGIRKVRSSITRTPFRDRSFDRIFLRSALYNLPKLDQPNVFREIKRIMKPTGAFILQTFYTTDEIQDHFNDIVNLRDLASGDYHESMHSEHQRYFATEGELARWAQEAHLSLERVLYFEGHACHAHSKDMTELGRRLWVDYVNGLPIEIKGALKLRNQPDGSILYTFPGAVYRLRGA